MSAYKKKTRVLSVILSIIMILSFSLTTVSAADFHTESESNATKALKLINELVQLDMKLEGIDRERAITGRQNFTLKSQQTSIHNRIEQINDQLIDMGVTTLDATANSSVVAADYPLPPSTDKIRFYSIADWTDDNERIYILIAAPIENSNHSANQKTELVNATNFLTSGAQTLVQIYASKLYAGWVENLIPIAHWFPYELFPSFFPTPTSGQVDLYEARLLTRTVTQFIYKKNSADQPVYYGSTSCVHVNSEEIVRKYNGSELNTETQNTFELITAENYYDFARIIVNENPSGYAVQRKHSFVHRVDLAFDNEIELTIYPVQYTLPIQASY